VAIYHLSVKPVSRGGGRSATAASAYRAAELVHDQTTGETFDYTRKRGVEHAEIVLPAEAAKRDINWARDREALWNEAERAENRSNSRVAREYEIALPHELTKAQRLELVRGFAAEIADRHGVAVDFAIHAPHREGDERNHHAHLLATTRVIEPGGLGEKSTIEWSDTNRRKAELEPARKEIEAIRERWAVLANEKLLEHGHEIRIDHRSLEAQGIEREPTTHLGPAVSGMERRGIETEVGKRLDAQALEAAQQRLEKAAELGKVERESRELTASIIDVSGNLEGAKRERDLMLARARELSGPKPCSGKGAIAGSPCGRSRKPKNRPRRRCPRGQSRRPPRPAGRWTKNASRRPSAGANTGALRSWTRAASRPGNRSGRDRRRTWRGARNGTGRNSNSRRRSAPFVPRDVRRDNQTGEGV
jgi:hypothetical protein